MHNSCVYKGDVISCCSNNIVCSDDIPRKKLLIQAMGFLDSAEAMGLALLAKLVSCRFESQDAISTARYLQFC